jgi:hypothetical protein
MEGDQFSSSNLSSSCTTVTQSISKQGIRIVNIFLGSSLLSDKHARYFAHLYSCFNVRNRCDISVKDCVDASSLRPEYEFKTRQSLKLQKCGDLIKNERSRDAGR